jgi:hypothetical protein
MQNLDPKEQFFWGVGFGLVWFGFVCGDLGLTKSLCCLATALIKLSLLLSVRCGLWVVGWSLGGGFVLFCCFFIWLSTREKKKNARRWVVRERREEKRREEKKKKKKKKRKKIESKKTKEDHE